MSLELLGMGSLDLFARIVVVGRPVPWQVVTGSKARARGAGSVYAGWKSEVQKAALEQMVGLKPLIAPCWIDTLFFMRPPGGRQKAADADNLRKGLIDALQGDKHGIGCVLVDDILVVGGTLRRTIEPGYQERAVVYVYTFADPDFQASVVARRRLLRPLDRHGVRTP